MRLVLWAAAIAGALTPTSAAAAEQAWTRATTPNFELYTTESPAKAREAVLLFEKVRA